MPLSPPKSFDGISARELLSAERVVDDGGEPLPPSTVGGPSPVDLAFHARTGWSRRLVAQPAEATDYFGNHRPPLPIGSLNYVRLVGGVKTAGASGAYVRLLASADGATGTFVNAGDGGAEVVLPIDAVSADGDIRGVGVPLRSDLGDDPSFKIEAVGGDGIESPSLARLSAQFYAAPDIAYDILYWSPDAAEYVPATSVLQTQAGVTTPIPPGAPNGACPCPPAVVPFLSVSGDLATPRSLTSTRGSGSSTVEGTTNTTHQDWQGWCDRFVLNDGAIVGGQTVPASVVIIGCGGKIASALPIGGGCGFGVALVRESDGAVMESATVESARPGWFVGLRGRVLAVPFPATVLPAGDRYFWVLDVALSIEVSCSCGPFAHAQAFPVWAYYNGGSDFTHDQDLTGLIPASYLRVPRLRIEAI